MELEKRRLLPGSTVIYACPDHPDVTSDKPGVCAKEGCGKMLSYKVVSAASRPQEVWICSLHPERTADGKMICPECKGEMKHLEVEQMLAVPFDAVIDTGERKVAYVARGNDVYEGVLVEVGPRAGEFYPVLKGLAAGDRVVTSGAFLLDAEARLDPAAGAVYFGAQEVRK
jgi:hypothetical protein